MKIKRDYLLTILATLVLIWVTTNPLVRLIPALFTSLTGIFILSILLYIVVGEIVYTLLFVVLFLFVYQFIYLFFFETFVSSSSSSFSSWSPENVNVFKPIDTIKWDLDYNLTSLVNLVLPNQSAAMKLDNVASECKAKP